jgi:hypothetical protein
VSGMRLWEGSDAPLHLTSIELEIILLWNCVESLTVYNYLRRTANLTVSQTQIQANDSAHETLLEL